MGFSIQRWMLDYVTPPCKIIHVYYAEFIRGLITISMFAFMNTKQVGIFALVLCSLQYFCLGCHNRLYNRLGDFTGETAVLYYNNGPTGAVLVGNSQQYHYRTKRPSTIYCIYVLELLTYFYLSAYFPVDPQNIRSDPNRWQNFLLTTYAWILVHTLDG
ncbi:unnamed protein product [Cylicostephanus goldi]|uniref:Uncharacterized protein n=1 Tax=Cylicostephanus goldi TaxID=71465 RepID=A0A3P6S2Y8_CYLGO|nr:unnamed protein product [Cylicostephanus goldi]